MSKLIGQTLLDRYHILEHIGRGGMAEVYKVWDARRSTHFAMKMLHEDLALDHVFIRRFKREATTLSKLQHPYIVRLYDFKTSKRIAFMILDYVAGETLKHKIYDAGGPISYEQIRNVFRSICGALQYAHQEGFVHCDIKPGNIMFDESGKVLLSDFGISRMTDAATATMVGVGTPAYMSPEQVRGEDPTPQTDIYALGVVLFEMLTGGERPFTGERSTSTGSTSEKVRWEQMHLDPPSPTKWNPKVSPEMQAVVSKCLEKKPADRYETALDLLNDLEMAIGTGETIKAGDLDPVIVTPDPKSIIQFVKEGMQKIKLPARVWAGIGVAVLVFSAVVIRFGNGGRSTDLGNVESQDNQPAEVAKNTNTSTPVHSPEPSNTPLPTKTIAPSQTPTDSKISFDKWVKSANILLFEDVAGTKLRWVKNALDNRGYNYFDVKDYIGDFEILLTENTEWDLIIYARENRYNTAGHPFPSINKRFNEGTSLIIEIWDLDKKYFYTAVVELFQKCGVEWQKNWVSQNRDLRILYHHDTRSPILNSPNSIKRMNALVNTWKDDQGDLLELVPGGDATIIIGARETLTVSHGTVISCIDNRLIIQTHATHNYDQTRSIPLWENYIYNALRARYNLLYGE